MHMSVLHGGYQALPTACMLAPSEAQALLLLRVQLFACQHEGGFGNALDILQVSAFDAPGTIPEEASFGFADRDGGTPTSRRNSRNNSTGFQGDLAVAC